MNSLTSGKVSIFVCPFVYLFDLRHHVDMRSHVAQPGFETTVKPRMLTLNSWCSASTSRVLRLQASAIIKPDLHGTGTKARALCILGKLSVTSVIDLAPLF